MVKLANFLFYFLKKTRLTPKKFYDINKGYYCSLKFSRIIAAFKFASRRILKLQ